METSLLLSFILIILTAVNLQLSISARHDSTNCSDKLAIEIWKQPEPVRCKDPSQELTILVQYGWLYVNVTTCEEVTVYCTLNQPVTWSYDGVGIPAIGHVKLITDFDGCYTAIISVRVGANVPYGKTSIGRYTCSSLNAQDNKTDYVQIFKADTDPIAFVQPAGINGNISYNDSNELIIPCMANWPYVYPTILKETAEGSTEISYTKYNSRTGFHLKFDSNNQTDALGTYICQMGPEANASKEVFNVHKNGDLGKPSHSEEIVIDITREESCSRFACGTRSKLEHELAFFPCQNIKHCEYLLRYAQLAVQFPEESTISDVCDQLEALPGSLIRNKTQTGVVLCREKGGNKYNFAHHYQQVKAPPVSNYPEGPKSIKPEGERMEGIDANVLNKTYYVNGTLDFAKCYVSEFLFAERPRWLVGLNGSFVSQWGNVDVTREHGVKILSLTVNITSEDIQSLICAAPRWDSHEWVNLTFPLSITRGTPPQLVNSSTETVYVNGSKKVDFIFVQYAGDPTPWGRWTKDGKVIPSSKVTSGDNQGETMIKFKSTAENDQGEYECEVSNFAGSFTRAFHVVVEPSLVQQPTGRSYLTPALIGIFSFGLILIALFGLEMKFNILKRKLWRKLFPWLPPPRYQGSVTEPNGSLSNRPSSASLVPSGPPCEVVRNDVNEGQPDGDRDLQISQNCQPHPVPEELEEAITCNVITKEDICKENMDPISCGSFGIVYYICKGGREFALKRMKDDGIICSKQFLAELRFFHTIGRHKNILGFEGAVKVDALLGDIFIVTEFCRLGDIETYLKGRMMYFRSTIRDDKVFYPPPVQPAEKGKYQPAKAVFDLTTIDFIQWAIDCAAGMDFLAKKGHVHGDLAPRNLLLDGNGTLKISDFGLSRMLKNEKETPYYRFSNDNNTFPWDHYNLEFFDGGKITTLTDIWAYGVTMWEIFELGKKPFEGRFDGKDTDKYARALRDGLRLPQPKNATTGIYSIMESCWNPDLKKRSLLTFEDLEKSFKAQLPTTVPYVVFQSSTDRNSVVRVNMNENSSTDVTIEMSPLHCVHQGSMNGVMELPTETNAATDTSQTDGYSSDDQEPVPLGHSSRALHTHHEL